MPFSNTELYRFDGNWNDVPGVYGIMDSNRNMIYVGETDSFKRRMTEYHNDPLHAMHRYGPVYAHAEVITAGEQARRIRERVLTLEYDPPANRL